MLRSRLIAPLGAQLLVLAAASASGRAMADEGPAPVEQHSWEATAPSEGPLDPIEQHAIDITPAHVDLLPEAPFALQPPGGLKWPAVQQAKFERGPSSRAAAGAFDGTWWARLDLVNPDNAPVERWVVVDLPTLDDVRFFDATAPTQRPPCGVLHPVTDRELRRTTCAFRVQLAGHEAHRFYLSASSQFELDFSVSTWRLEELAVQDRERERWRSIPLGIIFAMVLMNLLNYLYSRERAAMAYSISMGVGLIWFIAMDGTLFLIEGLHRYPRAPLILASIGNYLGMFAFIRSFLELSVSFPRADRWVGRLWWLVVAEVGVYFLFDWRTVNTFDSAFGTLTMAIAVTLGIMRWRQGYRPAAYFTIGWASFLVLYAMLTVMFYGMTSYGAITQTAPLLAGTFEAVVLAAALAEQSRERTSRIALLQGASSRFVPSRFLELLGQRDLPGVRHGQQVTRTMTVWFSDLRSFTTIAERLSPSDTMALVNSYLSQVEPIITRHGGVVDKYIGDAIMALFDSADEALAAAHEAMTALEGLPGPDGRPLRMGIGLHTGPLVLGVVGSQDRLACTVLGDSVNLASRMEGLTRTYGVGVLCTGDTVAACSPTSRPHLREIDRVRVKGKGEPVSIFELVPAPAGVPGAYEVALERYRSGRFAEAQAVLETFVQDSPSHGPARTLLARCLEYLRDPPAQWDGVTTLYEK